MCKFFYVPSKFCLAFCAHVINIIYERFYDSDFRYKCVLHELFRFGSTYSKSLIEIWNCPSGEKEDKVRQLIITTVITDGS